MKNTINYEFSSENYTQLLLKNVLKVIKTFYIRPQLVLKEAEFLYYDTQQHK